ncbi:hypothetical protein GW17_00042424 [Ensete ventricosum]|nr:hypothetical protein GW17_00042424 [Ensete ventricosum]
MTVDRTRPARQDSGSRGLHVRRFTLQTIAVSGSSPSGIPSPVDAKSQRDLEVMKSCALDLDTLRRKLRMPSGKNTPATGAESSPPEVEEIRVETTTKRPVGSPAPDQAVAGRPGKWVKIVMRKHKSRHGDGSSWVTAREKEPEAPAKEDSSPSYRRPRSMKDLCGTRICKDDEGYYALQMADWAPRDPGAAMQARWSNLLYLEKVWVDSQAASEFGRGVLQPTLAKDLYTLPSEILIAQDGADFVRVRVPGRLGPFPGPVSRPGGGQRSLHREARRQLGSRPLHPACLNCLIGKDAIRLKSEKLVEPTSLCFYYRHLGRELHGTVEYRHHSPQLVERRSTNYGIVWRWEDDYHEDDHERLGTWFLTNCHRQGRRPESVGDAYGNDQGVVMIWVFFSLGSKTDLWVEAASRPLLDCGPGIGLAHRGAIASSSWSADYDVNLSFDRVVWVWSLIPFRSSIGVISLFLDIMAEMPLAD